MTAAGAPHPFPPVVRWAVFPALAALAGAAGGALAAALDQPGFGVRWAMLAGAISAGAAFGAMLSRRPWIPLLAGPLAGLLVVCSAVSGYQALESRSESPWQVLMKLVSESGALLTIGGGAWLQTAAHLASLRPTALPSWPRGLAFYAGAGVLSAALAAAQVPGTDRNSVALLFFFSATMQAASFRASLALARRLQMC